MILFETVNLTSVSIFYFFHALISSLVSFVAAVYLSRRYKDNVLIVFLMTFIFNIAIPVIGYLFTIWMVYYLLFVKYARVLINTKTLNMQELDHEFPNVKRLFGEGSMAELMSNNDAPKTLRMKALSVVSQDMNRKNIALIKQSLSNKDDEIRLYSFSLIDNMEQDINTKIHQASLRFNRTENIEEKMAAAAELAYLYWDMIYFDLSDDTLKNFLLDESLRYAQVVFDINMSDRDMNVLLGKIYLEKQQFENATTHFVMAIENGVDEEYIVPYLAELYFERGNYRSVASMLNTVKSLSMNATMYPVVAQWKHNA
jgi:polysaccharide biosynthesis protein PelE